MPATPNMEPPSSSRFYRTPDDVVGIDPAADIGGPGAFPFTRGDPARHVSRPSLDDAPVRRVRDGRESNRRYRYLLAQGVMGLSVAFDLPTQIGYDSDHPLAAGEVGRVGRGDRLDRRHGVLFAAFRSTGYRRR